MTRPVVYPLREGRRPKPDHLRFSLRSVATHLPHSEVVIVGGPLPDWMDPSTVTHIPTDQGGRKFVNIGLNLHAALDAFRGSEVVWFNDDMFLLEDVDQVPLIDRGPIGPFCERLRQHKTANAGAMSTEHNDYLVGMEGQRQILRQWGYGDDTPCADLHVPIPLVVDDVVEVLERTAATNPDHPHGHFRMLYGAGRETVTMKDVKEGKLRRRIDEHPSPYISTYLKTWARGTVGLQLRDRFSEPSPYERQ